ncbi:hypothetical protein JCM15831A_01510 [Asaia astilbis]
MGIPSGSFAALRCDAPAMPYVSVKTFKHESQGGAIEITGDEIHCILVANDSLYWK